MIKSAIINTHIHDKASTVSNQMIKIGNNLFNALKVLRGVKLILDYLTLGLMITHFNRLPGWCGEVCTAFVGAFWRDSIKSKLLHFNQILAWLIMGYPVSTYPLWQCLFCYYTILSNFSIFFIWNIKPQDFFPSKKNMRAQWVSYFIRGWGSWNCHWFYINIVKLKNHCKEKYG